MKTIRPLGTRGLTLFLATALGVSVGFASPAFAQNVSPTSVIVNPDGKVTYLGTLGGSTESLAINDSGQVAGYSYTTGGNAHAFITGPDGVGMTDLGTLGGSESYAYGINDSGQVVGWSYTTGGDMRRAFITGPNGVGMTDLGTLGGSSSEAFGINDSGQVVGAYTTGGDFHAFITGPGGVGMTDLGTLGGRYSSALGINDSGQVVGHSETTGRDFISHAFITGPGGMGMTDLGTLSGSIRASGSGASGINDSGQVVGQSDSTTGAAHAFITGPDGTGMTDLGTLTRDGFASLAHGINDSGQVVGVSTKFATFEGEREQYAFITGPNGMGMTGLDSFADLPDGAYLSYAWGINNQGQVVASAGLIPEPASYALMLAGLGLVGFMARRKKHWQAGFANR